MADKPALRSSTRHEQQGESSTVTKSNGQQQPQQKGLPVPIHPDDAKDKVFTAILKALLKMGNKPSSPKELANVIVKYKYATLGGATPFATVSSRISQHFKRAAEHNPPRPPLLAKHFDENHSRKINYSLATEPPSTPPSSSSTTTATIHAATATTGHEPPSPPLSQSTTTSSIPQQQQQNQPPLRQSKRHRKQPSTTSIQKQQPKQQSTLSELSSDEEDHHRVRPLSHSKTSRHGKTSSSQKRKRKQVQVESEEEADDESDDVDIEEEEDEEEEEQRNRMKRIRHHLPLSPVTATSSSSSSFSSYSPPSSSNGKQKISHEPLLTSSQQQHSSGSLPPVLSPPGTTTTNNNNNNTITPATNNNAMDVSDEESEAEYSDYHEEMLKGDDVLGDIDRRRSSVTISRRPSIAQAMTTNDPQQQRAIVNATDSPRLSARRQSFSLMVGDDMWNVNNSNNNHYDQQDFDDPVFLDPSLAHQLPFNIATPESVSVAELEAYFNGDNTNNNNGGNGHNNNNNGPQSSSPSTSTLGSNNDQSPPPNQFPQLPVSIPSAARTTSRKSFSAMMGCRETSLLQRALLASTARGIAEAQQSSTLMTTSTTNNHTAAVHSTCSEAGDLPHQLQLGEEEMDEQDIVTRPRRKSWPDENTTSGSNLLGDDEEENELNEVPFVEKEGLMLTPSTEKTLSLEKDDDTKEQDNSEVKKESSPSLEKDEDEEEHEGNDGDDHPPSPPSSLDHYHGQRQKYAIIKKTFGPLECYQLDSPQDIPDTKVLRFIASTDGATEHVALRTRHAADSAKDRRNSQHFYLDQGYVNATQLRKAARPVLGKGPFDAAAEAEEGRVVVTLTKGPLECRGAWVPLSRARELVEEFEIESSPGLTKLLSDEPLDDEDDTVDEEKKKKDDPNNDTKQQLDHAPAPDNTSISTSSQSSLSSSQSPPQQVPKQQPQPSTLLDTTVDDDESFVQFEEDEDTILTTTTAPAALSSSSSKKPMESTNPFLSPTVPQITSAKTGNGDNKDVTAPPPPSPLDILKTLSIPNLNIAALQQMTAAIPGLAHLSSTIDLAKTLAAYMQTVNNHNNNNNKSPSSSSSPSPALPPNFASDFKQALARFPALETLFRKESFSSSSSSSSSLTTNAPATTSHLSVSTPTTPTTPHPPHSPQHPAFVHITDPQQQIVHTTMPTNPPMYITIVDNIPVCVAVLAPPTTENNNTTTTSTDQQQACRIMRRLDSGYINGTKLLTAGGIDTESERSMILSFEMERRRMPRKKSELYGTWIPLRRAQELAVTCSIQHRLGPFLSDSIESYFPSPLPIQVPMLSQHPGHHGHRRTTSTPPVPYATSSSSSAGNKDSRLAALTLQALRHPIGISDMTTTNGTTSSTTATSINSGASDGTTTHHTKGYGPSSPPTQTTSAAQLHQLLLGNNPRKFAELAQKAPLLGTFEGEGDTSDDEFGFDDEVENKQPPIIDSSNAKPVIITAGGRKTILGGPLNNKRKRKQLRKPKKKKKKQEEDESSDVDIVNSGSSSSSSSSSSEEEEEEEQVQQVQIIEEQIRQPMEGDEEEEDADTDTDTDVEEVRQRMKRMRDAAIDAMESGSSIDLEELLRRASSPIVENPRRGPLLTTTHTAATALPGNRIPLVNTIGNNGSSATGPSFNSMRRQGKATARRRPQGPGRSMGGKIAPSALKKSASWSGTLTSPLRVVVPTKKLQNKKHSSTATRPSKLRQNTAADELLVNRVVEHTSPSASSSSSQPSTSSSVTIIKVPTTVTHHHQNNNATTLVTSSSSDNVTTTVGGTNTTTASTMPTPSVVSAPTTTNTTTKHDLKPTPSSSTDVLATIQEDDEDEEIDIGGSEEDDDLR